VCEEVKTMCLEKVRESLVKPFFLELPVKPFITHANKYKLPTHEYVWNDLQKGLINI
jgi:hypothetical protein